MIAGAPRLRIAVALAAIGVAAAAPRPAAALAIAAVALAAAVRRRERVLRRVALPLLLGAVTAAAGLASGAPDAAARGTRIAARVLAGGAVGAWLCATVPLPALLGALAWARCPRPILELLALAARQLEALAGAAASVRDGQRARLGYAGLRRGVGSAGQLMGAVASRAMDRAVTLSDVLAVRGEPPIDPLPPLRAPAAGEAAVWAGLVVALGSVVLLGWGTQW